MRRRLDAELVRRGLARSRGHAAELIEAGQVRVRGMPAGKPASQVTDAEALTVDTGTARDWVSRGAVKLSGALDALAAADRPVPRIEGRRCLDAGASTGGFTEVLLDRGAATVLAVDVGYGQLAWPLRTDPRVVVHERTNVRDLTQQITGGAVDLVVGDLSFISLALVIPALQRVLAPGGDVFCMVKPQFEVGRGAVGKGGVVTDPAQRAGAVRQVIARAAAHGLGLHTVVASPLPGPSGNVEYFTWLRDGPGVDPASWDDLIASAVAGGPVGRVTAVP